MGKCKYCYGEFDYIPGIGVCISCKNAMSSSSSGSYDAEKSRKEAERARAEERAMDWRTYTDRFGNKVRVSGKTGDFQVKMFFWGWMGSSYKGNIEIRYPNGDLYVGGVHGSLYHGKGKKIWKKTGNSYEGDWVYNHQTGKGRFTWADGDYYEGDFVDGKRAGKGKYVWPDGCYYEGDFVDGKRTGKGKYVWPNGCYYEGDFVDGDFNGYGVRVYTDGYRYEGQFKDDKRHGKGVLTSPDGTAVEYYYENDNKACKAAEATDEIIARIYSSNTQKAPVATSTTANFTETITPEQSAVKDADREIWDKLIGMSYAEKEAFLSSHPEITVPTGVEKIPQYMFNNCLNLKSIRFNQDLREIGQRAFMGCKNLGPTLVIPSSVEKVGRLAFSTCHSVKKVVLPNNIHIEEYGLMCGVTEVEFETEPPIGVVLEKGAFSYCKMIMSKEMQKKIKDLNPKAFK